MKIKNALIAYVCFRRVNSRANHEKLQKRILKYLKSKSICAFILLKRIWFPYFFHVDAKA